MAHRAEFEYLRITLNAVNRSAAVLEEIVKKEGYDMSIIALELAGIRSQLNEIAQLYDPLCRAYGETTRSILVATERMYTASARGDLVQSLTEMHPASMRALMYGLPGCPTLPDDAKANRQAPSDKKSFQVARPSQEKKLRKRTIKKTVKVQHKID